MLSLRNKTNYLSRIFKSSPYRIYLAIRRGFRLCRMTGNYTSPINLCYNTILTFLNNPKDLDPSYKTDLDFWKKKTQLHLIAEEIRYLQLWKYRHFFCRTFSVGTAGCYGESALSVWDIERLVILVQRFFGRFCMSVMSNADLDTQYINVSWASCLSLKYSRPSVAQILMAAIPRLFCTHSWVPWKNPVIADLR